MHSTSNLSFKEINLENSRYLWNNTVRIFLEDIVRIYLYILLDFSERGHRLLEIHKI